MQSTGTTDLPVDVQIVLDLDRPMQAGTTGKIMVIRSDSTVVDTIDFSSPTQIKKVGGLDYNYFPLIAVGNSLILTLHTGVLDYGSQYSVQIDPGAIIGATGATFSGIKDTATIAFSTRTSPPPAGSRVISVNSNGSADFATVQGAIDFVPAGNSNRVQITIADGTYHELIYIPGSKPRITLQGQTRDGTVITYLNCRITGEPAAAGTLLGRIDPGVFPFSSAAYIKCLMGPHIDPVGWRLDNNPSAPDIRYFEFSSRDLDGNPLNVSNRLPASQQIAAALAAQYSNPEWVLGWNPNQRAWDSAFRPTHLPGPGWATDSAFGWVLRIPANGEFSPWLYLANFTAWAYFFPSSPNSHFFYSEQITPQGWFWSSRAHPHFIYSYSASQWIPGRP